MKRKSMAWMLVLAIMATVFAGCGKADDVLENVKDKVTATEAPKDSNEDETSNLGQWARAMGAILMKMNGGDPYYFGGFEANDNNKAAAQSILEQSWQIENRKQLITQIRQLIKTGQRKEYKKDAKEMAKFSDKELEEIMSELTDSMRLHYENVKYNYDKWEKKGVMAWDLCRVAHLAQWGYLAGYITVGEAQALIEPAAKKLQKNFTSWEDVQNNWLDGYVWWADVDIAASGNEYEKRMKVYDELKQAQEKDGVLFDDSLFTQEIVPISDISYKTLYKEVKKKKAKPSPTPAYTPNIDSNYDGVIDENDGVDTNGDGVVDVTPAPRATPAAGGDASSEEETTDTQEDGTQ